MKTLYFDEIENWTEPTVLVLGYFDGLHRGHQALFAEAKTRSCSKFEDCRLNFSRKTDTYFSKI